MPNMRTKQKNLKAFAASLIMAVLCFAHTSAVAQDNLPNPTVTTSEYTPITIEDKFRDAINSTVRITMKRLVRRGRSGQQVLQATTIGSGTIIGSENGQYVILTNNHVAGDVEDKAILDIEFFKDGLSRGIYRGICVQAKTLDHSNKSGPLDIAIVHVPIVLRNRGQTITPLATKAPASVGLRIFTCGCDGGKWPNAALGSIVESYRGYFTYLPSSYPGDSGSAVFSSDGSEVVGLTAWQEQRTNKDGSVTTLGQAMNLLSILANIIPSNKSVLPLDRDRQLIPRVGDDLPSALRGIVEGFTAKVEGLRDESKKRVDGLKGLIDGNQERILKLRRETETKTLKLDTEIKSLDDATGEIKGNLGDLSLKSEDLEQELGSEKEASLERAGLLSKLRDRIGNREKLVDDKFNSNDEKEDTRFERLANKFSGVTGMLNLVWYALITVGAITGATMFFGPGWLVVIMVKVWVTIIRGFKAVFTIVKSAFTSSPEVPADGDIDSFEERFELLRKELTLAMGDKNEPAKPDGSEKA
jgi:hypothetical protein